LAESPIAITRNVRASFSLTSRKNRVRVLRSWAFIADDGIPVSSRGGERQDLDAGQSGTRRRRVRGSFRRPIFAEDLKRAISDTRPARGFKTENNDAKPVAWGDYMTIWKRQADGTWKFVLDLGCRHAEPKTPAPSWEPPPGSLRQPLHDDKINIRRGPLTPSED